MESSGRCVFINGEMFTKTKTVEKTENGKSTIKILSSTNAYAEIFESLFEVIDDEDSFLEEFVGVSFDDLTIYTSSTSLEYKITEIEEEGVSESITVASYKLNKSGVQVESAEAYTSNLNVIDGTKMKTVSRVSIKPAVLGFVARPINYADYQEAN